jgi:hypothetical protein
VADARVEPGHELAASPAAVGAVNPRAEASQRLGGGYEARVLEPSPPAVNEEPWFADDPVARGEVAAGRQVVSPVHTGDLLWEDLAADDPNLQGWCSERWLAAYRRLPPAPEQLVATRQALHRLAEAVISPARAKAHGKIGLRYTRGGFGTPFFEAATGRDMQVRVQGSELIVSEGGASRQSPITTLAAAAELVGADEVPTDRAPLDVDAQAADFLGDWYGFAASVLEELRASADPTADPSRVQLWPEHFDLAVELGSEKDGARAAYGLSPGDERHPEPYIYVAPWVAPPKGPLWQAKDFAGAEFSYQSLLDAEDQRGTALGFLEERLSALTIQAPARPQTEQSR